MTRMRDNLVVGLLLISVALIAYMAVGYAIDRSIDNQNRMLCRSALKSGNFEWLSKCVDFYATGDIKYLRGAE